MIAMALLGKWREDDAPALAKALGSSNESTAKGASKALSMIGEQKPDTVVPLLIEALSAKTPVSAVHALPALKKLKKVSVSALPKIVEMYDKSDPDTKSDILDAVSAIDDSGDFAVPVCLKALKESNPLDRREALIALMRFESRASTFFDAVVEELEDKDIRNRLLALGIIRGLGPECAQSRDTDNDAAGRFGYACENSAISSLGAMKLPFSEVILGLEKALKDKDHRPESRQ